MSFLKTLFWIVVGVVIALFFYRNWHQVTVALWDGNVMDIKLPFLLAVSFALGFLPPFLLWRATLYRLRRQVQTHGGAIVPSAPAAPAASPAPPTGPFTTVPPGGA